MQTSQVILLFFSFPGQLLLEFDILASPSLCTEVV